MSYKDLFRNERKAPHFNLYLPPDASEAHRIAHRKYVAAVEAIANVTGDPTEVWAECARAKRNYGAILLREDKIARPHIYAREA